MTLAEFATRYQATQVELLAYVQGLPAWVNAWRAWMFFIFTAAFAFVIWKREARWLALTMVVSLFAYNVASMVWGVGRFPSIAFVVLWSPLALYFARRRPHLQRGGRFDGVYAAWVDTALATLIVSLAFDVYNVAYSLVWGVP